MTTELDRKITDLITAVTNESPSPHPWTKVTGWPTSEVSRSAPDREPRWRSALVAACLALIVLAGVTIAQRDNSTVNDVPVTTAPAVTSTTIAPTTIPPTTVPAEMVTVDESMGLAPLSDITLSSIPIPSEVPPGANFDPLVVRPPEGFGVQYAIRFDDGASLDVWSAPGPWRSEIGSETMTLNGTTWSVMERSSTNFQAVGTISETVMVIFSDGHERATFDRFIAGLRTGSITDYPGITYNIETGGTEVAGLADDAMTLDVRRVGRWRCWSLKSDVFADNGGCTDESTEPNGVLILSEGGTGIPENSTDPNAAIVTSIVRLAGVAPLDSAEIEIEFIDGQVVARSCGSRSRIGQVGQTRATSSLSRPSTEMRSAATALSPRSLRSLPSDQFSSNKLLTHAPHGIADLINQLVDIASIRICTIQAAHLTADIVATTT